jgi:polysaccharide export outer membrane protein
MRRNLVLFAIVMLGGCGGRVPLQSSSQLQVVSDKSLPPPVRTDLVAQARESLIGPLDTISVDVFNVPDLSREVQVDSGGSISLPLIGTVDARGKTSLELSRAIETALRANYVRNPEVTVNVKSSISQVVTVDGQVTEPGLYPVTNQMTLGRAIASAKGLSEFAKLDDVVILRTVNGQRMAGLYNMTAIRRGLYADPAVYPNDVIVVGDSPARRLFKDFVSVTPLLAAPLIALIQN